MLVDELWQQIEYNYKGLYSSSNSSNKGYDFCAPFLVTEIVAQCKAFFIESLRVPPRDKLLANVPKY